MKNNKNKPKKTYYKIDKEMCDALEFYDINRCFPWDKKVISITLSAENIKKLSTIKNKSKFIDELIKKNI